MRTVLIMSYACSSGNKETSREIDPTKVFLNLYKNIMNIYMGTIFLVVHNETIKS